MPIKGLTDRQAAFPEIGRIRKGAPKQKDRPGDDLTYFRIELDEAEIKAVEILKNSYPEKPAELNILLPFNSVDENFDAWREAYVAGGLVHRCDGERIWYEINPKTGERIVAGGDSLKTCDGSRGCKPTGRLKVLIPELQRLAYLTVLTGSIHDILNISRQLEALLQINGRLAGVPLKLRRRPTAISTPSGPEGKRARRIKSLLSIEADPEWVKHKLNSMRVAALPDYEMPDDLPALIAPDESDEDWTEEEIIELPQEEQEAGGEEASEHLNGNEGMDRSSPSYWPEEILQELIGKKYAANEFQAAGMLSYSAFDKSVVKTPALKFAQAYRAARDEDKSPKEAGEIGMAAYLKTLKGSKS